MDELKTRIEILVQGNVISKKVGDFAYEVVDYLNEFYPQKNHEMLLTHLAMAVQRIIEDENLVELDEVMWDEVKADIHFTEAEKILHKIQERSFIEFPKNEQQYLMMHICSMLS